MTNSLTAVIKVFSNTLIFFAAKNVNAKATHIFFSKKNINAFAIFQKKRSLYFSSLSFEQLGPGLYL